jgi:hypothetical protein
VSQVVAPASGTSVDGGPDSVLTSEDTATGIDPVTGLPIEDDRPGGRAL